MPRFFVQTLEPLTVLYGEQARHMARSLRMKAGETVTLCDGMGNEAAGVVQSLSPDAVSVRLGEVTLSQSEPAARVQLYVAVPKGDKAELILQKAVELGAASMTLVLTERCISRPADSEKKLARLQKIADEAAAQSGRGRLVPVRGILPLPRALEEMQQIARRFVLYEGECPPLRAQLPPAGYAEDLALFTGCEGGFSADEIAQCRAAGLQVASLGPRILRCETAPIAALAAVLFALGEMG